MTDRRRTPYTTWPAAVALVCGLFGLGVVGAQAATTDPAPCASSLSELQRICTTADVEVKPVNPDL